MKKIYSSLFICAICCATTPLLAQTELNTQPTAPAAQTEQNIPPAAPARVASAGRYRSSLNLELGWGAPYGGLGFTYGYNMSDMLELNAGAGVGVGGKIGVGGRLFLRPDREATPYLGVNIVRSGRIDNATLDLDGEQVDYSLKPSGVFHLRGGLRWQPGRVGLLSTLGYGIRFTGDPVVYNQPYPPSKRASDVIGIITPGGIELSLGITIGLN